MLDDCCYRTYSEHGLLTLNISVEYLIPGLPAMAIVWYKQATRETVWMNHGSLVAMAARMCGAMKKGIAVMAQQYHNFIGGEWVPSTGDSFEVRNPADTDEVVGLFPLASDDEVRAAIAAAQDAQRAWGETPGPERGEVLYRAAQIIRRRADEMATDLTREEGKTLTESKGEVLRSADILNYFAGEGRRMGGETLPAETRNTLLYTARMPLGVVAIITPWNFPIAIPVWKIAPALISGNAVVFKPASQSPLTAIHLAEVFDEAGLPKGRPEPGDWLRSQGWQSCW